MNWLYYLLEANLYLLIFFGFYKLVLHKETFYILNRFYFIATTLIAFILPFFQLGFLKAPKFSEINTAVAQGPDQVNLPVVQSVLHVQESIFTVQNAIISVYVLVAVFFLIKLGWNLLRILNMRKQPSMVLENGVKVIDLNESKVAFSFFNLLFLNPQLSEKDTIIKHELVHIKQKHSIDVILFELIQIVNWFNPTVYLIKKEVKIIHEYLADEKTTGSETEKYNYAMFLIQNSSGIENLSLTNQIFNSSILKRRITMLNQKKSASRAKFKLLLVLPVTAGILCLSTMAFTKSYGAVDLFPGKVRSGQDTSKFKYSTMEKLDRGSTLFTTQVRVDGKTKKQTSSEKRLILINGVQIEDNNDFFAAANFDQQIELGPKESMSKFGEIGKFGAVELFGKRIKVLKQMPPPPPKGEKSTASVVLLAPPPPVGLPVRKKENSTPKYSANLVLDRNKSEKLMINDDASTSMSLSVRTKFGEEVYQDTNYQNDWNGQKGNATTFLNNTVPSETYYYTVVVKTADKDKILKGYLIIK